jgi:hypothetical protein
MARGIQSSDGREPTIVFYDIELDDANLNPYQFRIYNRIARRSGGGDHECTESLARIAESCQMSTRTAIRAIKELASRRFIKRVERKGDTSHYTLLDKKHWLPLTVRQTLTPDSQSEGSDSQSGGSDSQSHLPMTHSHHMKKTIEEDKQEREREAETPLVSFVEEKPASKPFAPNDDFTEFNPVPQWSVAERFVLKACNLWDELANQEKPVVETNWRTKLSVQSAGKYVMPRLSVKNRIGGTPKLFREFWHDKLKREVAPRPDYLVEQWEAYDRWLIENYETHRRLSNAA